ncbi:DoxX family protein [Fulvivirgaceae bacterium BMA12]|uniref:DoxX family protein n=1 Tax=Agaribacillus aureus TaxID=3051825 RepID=A0ABT8LE91_9BACT|nr:DoxX family protein [Fulvivirgaceae bacterium BMA12]
MKPLIVLLSTFLIGLLIKRLSKKREISLFWVGRMAMGCMLVFTGVAHFAFTHGMAAMLPAWVPFKTGLIYLTGVFEILGAVGLLVPRYARITAIGLILFLILVLPANIYAAINHIDPITGTTDGPDINYLFFRIPLQLLFIFWIYLSAVSPNALQAIKK